MMQPTSSEIDVFDTAHLINPYPNLEVLRAQGAVVKLDKYNVYAITRFDECRTVLRDWETYASGQGVLMNDAFNQALAGQVVLMTDGDAHTRLRRIIGAPLTPKALEDVKGHINEEAQAVVAGLVGRDSIEAVTELAQHLPLSIVGSLVGLPEDGRENLLRWATNAIDASGPLTSERTMAAMGVAGEMLGYVQSCTRDRVKPGGWAAGIWAAVDRGDIQEPEAFNLTVDYIGPALETTIVGTANMVEAFAKHPDQYALLRSQPELVPNAVNEVLRQQSVFHNFTRVTTKDTELGGYDIPAGSRVMILYGAANRDERTFADPTRFDITRSNAGDHLALGYGRHACAGAQLARMEMGAILRALIEKVERIEFISSARTPNSSNHVMEHLNVRLIPA